MLSLIKVPEEVTEAMQDAYQTGLDLGADFATGFERYAYEDGEWVNREGQNVHQYVSDCFENYSQHSPWEQTASFWNSFGEQGWDDEIWAKFDMGLVQGATGVDSGD